MSKSFAVNEFVRRRIRRLRLSKGIKLVELASRLSLPASSYASMETGQCRISLDHLFRITGELGVDINDVWPCEAAFETAENRVYIRRIQEFRFNEIISLTDAEGAALLSVQSGVCKIVMHSRLSDFLLDRLILYVEAGRKYEGGLWFEKSVGEDNLFLFLKSRPCAPFINQLIGFYLTIWSGLVQSGKLAPTQDQTTVRGFRLAPTSEYRAAC